MSIGTVVVPLEVEVAFCEVWVVMIVSAWVNGTKIIVHIVI